MTDLQELHDQVLPDDDQVDVPFDQSWSVSIWTELESAGLHCDSVGCSAPVVVVARLGNGAGCYCEACWRGGELARFLAKIR